jgi:hypothetical protein
MSGTNTGLVHAKTYLLVNNRAGAFGIAEFFPDALKSVRREAGAKFKGKQIYTLITFTCARELVKIRADVGLNYEIPEGETAMRMTIEA